MHKTIFKVTLITISLIFTIGFIVVIAPLLIKNPDIYLAFASGFVNPFAAGFTTDTILTWWALCIWIVYEAKTLSIKHGWICIILGLVPGVAVGLSLYLVVRMQQINEVTKQQENIT